MSARGFCSYCKMIKSIIVSIGNHMISNKTNKIARARRASAIWGLWKMYKCLFIPNCSRKIMWLLINNIHEKISRWLSRRNARVSRSQEKLHQQLRHKGVRLIRKQKIRLAISEFLWSLTNQNAWSVTSLHWINSFLHCLKKMYCS